MYLFLFWIALLLLMVAGITFSIIFYRWYGTTDHESEPEHAYS
jgi:hypothetical protein